MADTSHKCLDVLRLHMTRALDCSSKVASEIAMAAASSLLLKWPDSESWHHSTRDILRQPSDGLEAGRS